MNSRYTKVEPTRLKFRMMRMSDRVIRPVTLYERYLQNLGLKEHREIVSIHCWEAFEKGAGWDGDV